MRSKCYKVRLKRLTSISDKAYLAEDFNGNKDVLPKSQVYCPDLAAGEDEEVWWISAWILEKKSLNYSTKGAKFYDTKSHRLTSTGSMHVAAQVEPISDNSVEELKR